MNEWMDVPEKAVDTQHIKHFLRTLGDVTLLWHGGGHKIGTVNTVCFEFNQHFVEL